MTTASVGIAPSSVSTARDGAAAAACDPGHGGAAQLGAMRRGGAHHALREAGRMDLRRRLGRAETVGQGDALGEPRQAVAAGRAAKL